MARRYFRRYRRGYGRRYGNRTVIVRGRTRFVGASRKTKRLVKWLTVGLVVVGGLAILKPLWLKNAMEKVGLKTA